MPFTEGQFEFKDNLGSTEVFGGPEGTSIGTVSTSVTNVPAAVGKIISGYQIQVISNDNNNLLISFDSGNTFSFVEMRRRNFRSSDVKGEIRQIQLKTTGGTISDAKFEFVLNFEED